MVSAVVITKNEERSIERCVRSLLPLTDDIVIVDSFSTDRTVEIAEGLGCRVFSRKFEGYGDQKNFGNQQAKNDWIFSLDADEEMTSELIESIKKVLPTENKTYFTVRRSTIFCGHKIRYGGWNPEYRIRLFNRNSLHWSLYEVHEILIGADTSEQNLIPGKINHYTVSTLAEAKVKTDKYSGLYAQYLFNRNYKYSPFKLVFSGTVRFIKEFIFQLGFLDGYYGLLVAIENSKYTYLKYNKLRLLYKNKKK